MYICAPEVYQNFGDFLTIFVCDFYEFYYSEREPKEAIELFIVFILLLCFDIYVSIAEAALSNWL